MCTPSKYYSSGYSIRSQTLVAIITWLERNEYNLTKRKYHR